MNSVDAAGPGLLDTPTGGLRALLWFFACDAFAIGMIMLVAPAQFRGPLYAFMFPQLTAWAFVLATVGAAALLAALGVFRGRWVSLVFLAGAVPFVAMGIQFARAAVISGLISWGLLGVTMIAAAILIASGRAGGRVLNLMFGVNQLAVGTALLVIPQQFDNVAVYGELSIGARPFLVPLFFIAGACLVLSFGLRSRRLQLLAVAIALVPCTVFAASFFSVHTWTGVMYYGLQVPFLVTLLYKRTTWRAVLATLAALGAVLSFASFLAGILGRPGPNTMDPLLGLALVPLCLLIAGQVGFRRKIPAAPWSFIVLMLVGAVLLFRAIAAMAPAVGPAAADGPRALAAGPAALLLCAVALWATDRSQWRWASHVGAGIAAAVIAVSLLNVVTYMTGVASVEVSLGLLRMRLDAALVLLVVGASLLGIVMPGLAGGPIEGRIFAGFAAIMVIAVSYKLLSDAVLGAALELAATDLRAGRELASAGSSALGALLFLMAVIAIGTGTIIARTITSPLRVLRRVIRAFAAGELQTRVPPFNDDQVGGIGRSFNVMADQLERSREALQALNVELEDRVDQRTAQLSTATIAQGEAERRSMIDPLTALLNRRGFELGTKAAHAAASRYGQPYAILSADLDGLKRVNDVLGHASGDRVLNAFSESLRASTRGSDILGRLGGDEFAALLLGADAGGASVVERKLSALFADALLSIGISAGVSIGVAVFPGDGSAPEDLLALGDSRMYRQKAARLSLRSG